MKKETTQQGRTILENQTGQYEYYKGDCDKHGEFTGKKLKFFSRIMRLGCPECSKESEEAEEQRKLEQRGFAMEIRIREYLGRSGIPVRFKEKGFDDYKAGTKDAERALAISQAYAKKFPDRLKEGGGLIFCGKPGTGKTHLSSAIASYVIKYHGMSALFTSVLSMTRKVKETYSKNAEYSERQVLQMFSHPDLLIVDEVGVQFGSDSEKQILFEIINNRYETMKPTIMISNLPLNELSEFAGERVIDRMKEGGGAVVSFSWESHRAAK